jgi:hypothetical protein
MPTVIESLEYFSRDCPATESRLVVAVPGQPQDLFEVTDVSRQGTSVVLHCQPLETPTEPEPEPSFPQAEVDSRFYKNEDVEFLSRHDPLRFYEDLR